MSKGCRRPRPRDRPQHLTMSRRQPLYMHKRHIGQAVPSPSIGLTQADRRRHPLPMPSRDKPDAGPFLLGPILIEPALNRISAGGRAATLEPKVMRLLLCLASQHGNVVQQRELRSRLWGRTHVVEGVLARAAYQLRKALARVAGDRLQLETIRGTGYRLLDRSAGREPLPAGSRPNRRWPWRSAWLGWGTAAALGLAMMLTPAHRLDAPVAAPGQAPAAAARAAPAPPPLAPSAVPATSGRPLAIEARGRRPRPAAISTERSGGSATPIAIRTDVPLETPQAPARVRAASTAPAAPERRRGDAPAVAPPAPTPIARPA